MDGERDIGKRLFSSHLTLGRRNEAPYAGRYLFTAPEYICKFYTVFGSERESLFSSRRTDSNFIFLYHSVSKFSGSILLLAGKTNHILLPKNSSLLQGSVHIMRVFYIAVILYCSVSCGSP